MRIEVIPKGGGAVSVRRDPANPRERYRTESAFWYAFRNALRAMGYDVIKKLMSRDGHMVSDGIYYVRTRDWVMLFHDDRYALRNVAEDFNKAGRVEIRLVWGEPHRR